MTIEWGTIFIGGLTVGTSVVGLLVVSRGREPLLLFLAIAGIVGGAWGIIEVVDAYGQANVTLAALGLSVGSVGGGYALASALLPYLAARRSTPELPDTFDDTVSGPLALIVAQIEPEHYRPSAIAQELERLAAAGLPEATLGIAPFLYAAQKARYRALGGTSPAARQARALSENVESELGKDFGAVRFVSGVGRDTLDRVVVQAAQDGFRNIVVATLAVGESYAMDRAKAAVDSLRPESHGLRLSYTPPLWGSAELCEHVSDLVWQARDVPEHTGVALTLHGQPDAWQKSHTSFDVQENSFANRVRSILIDRGLPQQNVRLCYAEWRNPDITETVRHLAALGCSRVLVCPACFPFESSVTIIDMQVSIRQARVEAHVSTVTIGAWGDNPRVAGLLAKQLKATARELG